MSGIWPYMTLLTHLLLQKCCEQQQQQQQPCIAAPLSILNNLSKVCLETPPIIQLMARRDSQTWDSLL
jgi:hypothetical protein